MRYEILGGLRVLRGQAQVTLGGPKAQRLLAALMVDAPRAVERDVLVERLWGDHPPATARTALQVHVSHLRHALEPDQRGGARSVVRTTGEGYVLEIDRPRTDADRFESLTREAEDLAVADPDRALGVLESARALWRGRPWGALADQPWLRGDVARLEELRRRADELWADVQLALGRHELIVDALARAVEQEPLREHRWEQLMVVLYRCGRQAEALRAFQDARRTLTEELGIEPTPALRALEQAVLVQDPSLDAPTRPPPARPRHNLPAALTSLVGREDDLRATRKLVEASRLVTLTGVGGVGKTRLAVQSSADLVPRFADGAWLVELAPISDPGLVPGSVAATLGLRERGGQSVVDMIADYLADRSLLLVVDNCEHVIDAAARLVDTLLNAAPNLHVLGASREALGLPYEQVLRVPVLEVPAPSDDTDADRLAGSAAVRLFVERARAVMASFGLTAENQADVAELCRRLDGIPLALELAAVRIDSMTPAEIVHHLEHRFQLLGVDRKHAGRHQTLRGTIDWSHQLLERNEQTLFSRLSVFAGGWTITTARSVAAGSGLDEPTVLDGLAGLVRKSMVVAESVAKTTRYRMLESLRRYAHERLVSSGEEVAVRTRHAEHFTRLVEGLADDVRGPRQDAAYRTLLTELDNIRAAFDWHLAAGDAVTALRLVRILRTFWTELMPSEGVQRALAAVALGGNASPAARAGGLADAAWIGYVSGREECARHAEESVAVSQAAGIPHDPEALCTLALADLYAGRFDRALARLEEATVASRAIDDPYEIAAALTGTCMVRAILGDTDAALAAGEEAVAIARDLGYVTQIAGSLGALGFAWGARDLERGVALLDESLALKSDTTYSALARVVSGHLRVMLGDHDGALRLFGETLEIYGQLGDAFYLPTSLEGTAAALCSRGRAAAAARLLGASEEVRRKLTLPGLPIEIALRQSALDMVAASVTEDERERELIVGRRWSVEETVAYARGEIASIDTPIHPG
ncbi:MAG TPA: BTAD domain-containing putative transcriptional regulator [Acidimicrobiia bacterium]|nr:BTAD domain-containing putative transcriptional regulator [Acidimicrobiia bacterium]